MNKKQIKRLVAQSYHKEELDIEKVKELIKHLKRSDLKLYIKQLKQKERQKNVVVTLPYPPRAEYEKKLADMFPMKNIVYVIDPSLISGIKIMNDDEVSEYSIKNSLDELLQYLENTYD